MKRQEENISVWDTIETLLDVPIQGSISGNSETQRNLYDRSCTRETGVIFDPIIIVGIYRSTVFSYKQLATRIVNV